jgi:hypothetical protein
VSRGAACAGALVAALAAAMPSTSAAQPTPTQELDPDWLGKTTPEQIQESGDSQLRFIAFFFTRMEISNIAAQNDLLSGRVGGRLFGSNTTTTSDAKSFLAEQRFVPFFQLEPRLLNHWARLRASFEINFTWGDSAYGTGGNFGGALGARQINLETQNLNVELNLPWRGWYVTLGLQRLVDNPRDPYRTLFSTLAYTGTRLAFWGSDAVGVAVYGHIPAQVFKLGAYDLYENSIAKDDNVWLFEAMTDRELGRGLHLGGQARYVRDTSGGAGGVAVIGQGPGSALPDYMGAFRFPVGNDYYHAHVVWLTLDMSYNPEFAVGRLGGSAFVVGNFGVMQTAPTIPMAAAPTTNGSLSDAATIAGVAANVRLGYRYGSTRNDHVVAEFLYTSGDANGIKDQRYSGVITGNSWGAPAGLYVTSGAYLLFPHPNVINRTSTAVFDISNMGWGLSAATVGASYDFIPNVFTGKLGTAVAFSNIAPPMGGNFIGVEGNGSLVYRLRPGLTIELHGAYLRLGDFYDSPNVVVTGTPRPRDPWMTMLALKWLII